jgi:hypothetical protein
MRVFQAAGFSEVGPAGARRHVVQLRVSQSSATFQLDLLRDSIRDCALLTIVTDPLLWNWRRIDWLWKLPLQDHIV